MARVCPQCRYDRSADYGRVCPECGSPLRPVPQTNFSRRRQALVFAVIGWAALWIGAAWIVLRIALSFSYEPLWMAHLAWVLGFIAFVLGGAQALWLLWHRRTSRRAMGLPELSFQTGLPWLLLMLFLFERALAAR